jgi:hypothetical protein
MVLIDKEKGILTRSEEFILNNNVIIQEVTKPACLQDVLKIHDYRYIKTV